DPLSSSSFPFTDPTTTATYTLSLHDALPISSSSNSLRARFGPSPGNRVISTSPGGKLALSLTAAGIAPSAESASTFSWIVAPTRSEEHTSELQSLAYLVCRLLLEKKKKYFDS